MFFTRKKNTDVDEIRDIMDMPEQVEAEEMPIEREAGAPLFVKVDKYREVLRSLQEMKLFVGGVKQTFTVLHEIESIRADALNIMRATVQRLEKSLTQVDTDLLRPKGISLREMGVADTEVRHLEESLTDLQKQLAGLRQELQGLG